MINQEIGIDAADSGKLRCATELWGETGWKVWNLLFRLGLFGVCGGFSDAGLVLQISGQVACCFHCWGKILVFAVKRPS
jgi:hypothetical protein